MSRPTVAHMVIEKMLDDFERIGEELFALQRAVEEMEASGAAPSHDEDQGSGTRTAVLPQTVSTRPLGFSARLPSQRIDLSCIGWLLIG
jgi:hypothetical protein